MSVGVGRYAILFQAYSDLGRLIVEVSRSHSIRHTDPEATYDLFDYVNYIMKIVPKSLCLNLVKLQGKFKITEKSLHIQKFLLYFAIFPCTCHQLISVADLG
jgi:hypothetical protein